MLLEFYAASGDFTRRLTSVKANGKFSHPDAGPDDYYSVRSRCLFAVHGISDLWVQGPSQMHFS